MIVELRAGMPALAKTRPRICCGDFHDFARARRGPEHPGSIAGGEAADVSSLERSKKGPISERP
jgi:hypothetical protein